MRRRVLQVFISDAVQVVGAADQPGIQRAQNPQHTHGFVAAGVEGGDFLIGQRGLGPGHQLAERVFAHSAKQVAMQLHFGYGFKEGFRK